MPREFHVQRSLAGYSPWGHKESDTTEHTHKNKSIITEARIYSGEKTAFSINGIGKTIELYKQQLELDIEQQTGSK